MIQSYTQIIINAPPSLPLYPSLYINNNNNNYNNIII